MHGRAVEVTAYRGRTEQVKGGGGGAQAHPQAMVSAGPARATVILLVEILTVFCKGGNGLYT